MKEKRIHISNSQVTLYSKCPYSYYLDYIKKVGQDVNTQNIYTIFGTAMHETLQEYLRVMYEESAKKADEIPIKTLLYDNMTKECKRTENEGKIDNIKEILTLNDLKEFYSDGVKILEYFKKKRVKYFKVRGWELVGIEDELSIPMEENPKVFFEGRLDVILKNTKTNKIKIIDIKTSTRGWKDKKKKDPNTRRQLILYKDYYSKQHNIPLKDIEVEYLILKRKIYEGSDWPIPRVQRYSPPSAKRTIKKYKNALTLMVENVFDENGNRIDDKEYPKNKSTYNCKYCKFKNTKHCDAW